MDVPSKQASNKVSHCLTYYGLAHTELLCLKIIKQKSLYKMLRLRAVQVVIHTWKYFLLHVRSCNDKVGVQ